MTTKEVTVKEWTDALRSGKYKQADGVLWDGGNSYCCLGVLCRIGGAVFHGDDRSVIFFVDEDGEPTDEDESRYLLSGVTEGSLIAATRRFTTTKFFRSKSSDGRYRLSNRWQVMDLLVEMNDAGESFEEIADVIERVLRPNAILTVVTK